MRGSFLAAASIGIWLMSCRVLYAGLYNTSEPPRGPRVSHGANDGVEALGFTQFRDLLADLDSTGNNLKESAQRKHYLARRDELLAKARAGGLSTEEKVDLSEYLIRLRDYEKAVELLTPVAAQERRNFMVFANLATAHQLAGRLDRALSYLQQVKDFWPREWPGLSREQLKWYERVEKYHLRLVGFRVQRPAWRTRVCFGSWASYITPGEIHRRPRRYLAPWFGVTASMRPICANIGKSSRRLCRSRSSSAGQTARRRQLGRRGCRISTRIYLRS